MQHKTYLKHYLMNSLGLYQWICWCDQSFTHQESSCYFEEADSFLPLKWIQIISESIYWNKSRSPQQTFCGGYEFESLRNLISLKRYGSKLLKLQLQPELIFKVDENEMQPNPLSTHLLIYFSGKKIATLSCSKRWFSDCLIAVPEFQMFSTNSISGVYLN